MYPPGQQEAAELPVSGRRGSGTGVAVWPITMRKNIIFGFVGLILVTSGCSSASEGGDRRTGFGPGETPSGAAPSDTSGAPTPGGWVATAGADEMCDGYDNNGDGRVDEGCSCEAGTTQSCFPGAPGTAVGECMGGTQACTEGNSEFREWGPCTGAVLPEPEQCGDGIDQDCDGSDAPCEAPTCDPRPEICGNGIDEDCDGIDADCSAPCDPTPEICGNGIDEDCDGSDSPCMPACVPTEEICGDGIDQDCDGVDAPCPDELCQDIFLFGDCLTMACPASHPYPKGCNVLFTPGDDRGCVASDPSSPVVYFQAGDQCNAGFVTGTLCCAKTPQPPLNQATCPINKPIPIHTSSQASCPATR